METEPTIYGVVNHMSFGEALGNTGGKQTTTLEAKINGIYIGKFDNRASHTVDYISDWYPSNCTCNDPPHAEDYMLAGLNKAYSECGKKWSSSYPRHSNQKFDLLSIKSDKTACPVCASNLIKFCTATGLRVREKASTYYPDETKSGAEILRDADVPVRHWEHSKIFAFSTTYSARTPSQSSYTSPSIGVKTWKDKNENDAGSFPLRDLGWSAQGYGRKSGSGNW